MFDAKNYALKLISIHPRTVYEIKLKLKLKKYSVSEIDQLISFLQENNYLNDENYVRQFLELQLKNKPAGRFYYQAKLRQKGIAFKVIKPVLDELYPHEKELELAQKIAKKYSDPQKIGSRLKQKGFSEDIIFRIIDFMQ